LGELYPIARGVQCCIDNQEIWAPLLAEDSEHPVDISGVNDVELLRRKEGLELLPLVPIVLRQHNQRFLHTWTPYRNVALGLCCSIRSKGRLAKKNSGG
jgi:hypothetical protein